MIDEREKTDIKFLTSFRDREIKLKQFADYLETVSEFGDERISL